MFIPLSIIAPVFGLIALGFICGRYKLLPESAASGISEFAFRLAIPALLFRTVATAKFEDVSIWSVWLSFYGAVFITWLLATVMTWRPLNRPAQDAPAISMSTTFGNTVMLGLPLCISTFGNESAATLALVFSIHAPTIWLLGSIHVAVTDRQPNQTPLKLLKELANELAHNPIVVGIAIGALWRLTGQDLPDTIDQMSKMLSGAGVPCALIALGLSLVNFTLKGQIPTLAVITGLKLVFMPIVAWFLATHIMNLPPLSAGVITLLAATPNGVNGYLFAQRYQRAVNSASGAVAMGTMLSVITLTVVVALIHP